MEAALSAFGFSVAVAVIYMTGGFVASLYLRRADIADVLWGPGFIVVGLGGFIHWNILPSLRQVVILVLVMIWGIRLGRHIYARFKTKSEDFRYVNWRKEWGSWFTVRSYLQVFLLQGVLLALVAAPITFVMMADTSLFTLFGWGVFETLGVALWCLGYYFESRGDRELRIFIAQPENAGKILTKGLWAYTRHPNYFGEVAQWWGIFCIALGMPFGWVSIIGPLTITVLILKISGIPMLEKKYAGNPEFEAYKQRTSAFFPLPPKHN